MNTFIDICQPGDVIKFRPSFGTGPLTSASVTMVEEDVKNGRPGGEVYDTWFYADQVDTIVKSDGRVYLRESAGDNGIFIPR